MKNEPTQNSDELRADPVSARTAPVRTTIASDGTERPKHFATDGEKKFDALTYNHIGYIANALLSVVAVYWVERTHGGQQMMKKFGAWAAKTIPRIPADTAEYMATRSFYLAGGFAVLLPMKWLEDRKVSMIRNWNEKIYGEKLDTDPVLVQSEKELERAPKQTWLSIFSSRALALVPFYATVGFMWDRKSILSRMTDSKLRGLPMNEIRALEKEGKLISKGLYFDRPIAAVSRFFGKAAAKLGGNEAAVVKIEEMSKKYPGMNKQGAIGSADRDPIHSTLPHYFISEAITSAVVAWGVYVLTRITAVLFHNKPHLPQTGNDTAPVPVMAAVNDDAPVALPKHEQPAPRMTVQHAQLAGGLASHTPHEAALVR